MGKFGCLLMLISFAALCIITVIPVLPPFAENETIDNFLASLVCQPGEQVLRDQYQRTDSDGTSYSMNVYCINSERQREDVTGKWFLISIIAFLLPFLVGLFGVIFAANRNTRKITVPDTGFGSSSPIGTVNFGSSSDPIMGLSRPVVGVSTSSGKSLADRLKEVQEARDAGLITAEEYDRLRREILDKEA